MSVCGIGRWGILWNESTWAASRRSFPSKRPEQSATASNHRPPGGESWADICLRLRSVLRDLACNGAHGVLVVAHDIVVQLTVALLTGLDERATVELVRGTDPPTADWRCCVETSRSTRRLPTTAPHRSSSRERHRRRRPIHVTSSAERPVLLTPGRSAAGHSHRLKRTSTHGGSFSSGGAGRTPGAASLAGIASLRVGAGQLRLAVADTAASRHGRRGARVACGPVAADPTTGDIAAEAASDVLQEARAIDVLCLGPGLHGDRASQDLTSAILFRLNPAVRVVLDAMALPALRTGHSRADRPEPLVVTPQPWRNRGSCSEPTSTRAYRRA